MNTRRKTMPNNSNLPKSGGTMRYPLLILFCLLSAALTGANLYNIPSPVTQPDGSVLQLLASGDEYANRLHDAQGYTIIQSPTDGYYYFAELRTANLPPSTGRIPPIPAPWASNPASGYPRPLTMPGCGS